MRTGNYQKEDPYSKAIRLTGGNYMSSVDSATAVAPVTATAAAPSPAKVEGVVRKQFGGLALGAAAAPTAAASATATAADTSSTAMDVEEVVRKQFDELALTTAAAKK
jgi:hypothetical protein